LNLKTSTSGTARRSLGPPREDPIGGGECPHEPDGEFPVASFQMPDKTAPPGVEDSARIVLVLLLVLEAMGWCVGVGGLAGIEYEYRPAG
jgi:hypothetical protein